MRGCNKARTGSCEHILKCAGLSVTRPRVLLLQLLTDMSEPASIDVIQRKVGAHVNMVTIYRVLKQLVAAGLVYQTDFREGKAYFEYQDPQHHHHHITCTSCGMRESVAQCDSEALCQVALKGSRTFRSITGHTMEFFGICSRCTV
jgi:Fe2+ or Zn2+ uptake regulation protein